MERAYPRTVSECRVDLYDMCLGLAETIQIALPDFADELGVVSPRELAAMRGPDHNRPHISIPRLAIIMLALQDQVNAKYFHQLRNACALNDAQGELFASMLEDDECPF